MTVATNQLSDSVLDGEVISDPDQGAFISGTDGGDVFFFLSGDDTIFGGGGADRFYSGYNDGDDLLIGGDGLDHFTFQVGLNSGFGNDTIVDLSDGDLVTFLNYSQVPISVDVVFDGADSILTFGAGTLQESTLRLQNYYLDPYNEFDGLEVDLAWGFNGTPYNHVSNDTLTGGAEHDTLEGFAGDDVLIAAGGFDRLSGGLGDDTLIASAEGHDNLYGGDGNDVLIGGAQDDVLEGNAGDDVLSGNGGNDLFDFYLGDGNDTITDFGAGDQLRMLDYQAGQYTYSVSYTDTDTILTLAQGTDQDSSVTLQNYIVEPFDLPDSTLIDFRYSLFGGASGVVSDDVVVSSSDNDYFVSSGAGDDLLLGSDGFDYLFGGHGADTILGGETRDVIGGGIGDDILNGGAGDDEFTFEIFSHAGREYGFGNDVIEDFGEGDAVKIFVGADAVPLIQIAREGGDSFLTLGGGTEAESRIRFDNFDLMPEDVQVEGSQITIQDMDWFYW